MKEIKIKKKVKKETVRSTIYLTVETNNRLNDAIKETGIKSVDFIEQLISQALDNYVIEEVEE